MLMISEVSSLIVKKKIKIIEDCAQAIGARIGKQKVTSIGDFSCFSFHAQKHHDPR